MRASVLGTIVGIAVLRGAGGCAEGSPAVPPGPYEAPPLQKPDASLEAKGATDPNEAGDAGESGDDLVEEEAACSIELPNCPASPPSWSRQVRGIVSSSCGACHEDGGIEQSSNFNYSTYANVHEDFGSMLSAVYGCLMPPPDAAALSPADTQILLEWLVCGAPDN